ncbi:MAG: RNA 3'-phosphate cyclase [Chloroflexi bacterium]|nr:RNA 3'-phosphate cyclase [Chloroflexota bacterium]
MDQRLITIDGSYGEGGGQILRTALALSAITGKPFRLEKIRAGRKNPGLQAQHLTAVQACAEICRARLEGAELSSPSLAFIPQSPPLPGEYAWDVAEARQGGSAGAVSLILQTVIWPLALADSDSRFKISGGTHVPFSPPFHYIQNVLLPTLAKLGVKAEASIEKWGWYPRGEGEIEVRVKGKTNWQSLELVERGALLRIQGISAVSNLPISIAQRQIQRADEILEGAGGGKIEWEIISAPASGPGTCVFIWVEGENVSAGFTALGARGKPAEKVAEEATRDLLRYLDSGMALDMHLADQLILPLALAPDPSHFTTCRLTRHLLTNIWTVSHFLTARFEVRGQEGEAGEIWCYPQGEERQGAMISNAAERE